ncbi:unnamed protein product [Clonostachys rosea]|uniref:Uncharacterized protein n=1 Tax=Bionectria ochroleuca TaxID=29856 RepID=A0ABY6UZ65_BIOOC|nr:unnamed protein product [Clonostachys rosea]
MKMITKGKPPNFSSRTQKTKPFEIMINRKGIEIMSHEYFDTSLQYGLARETTKPAKKSHISTSNSTVDTLKYQ